MNQAAEKLYKKCMSYDTGGPTMLVKDRFISGWATIVVRNDVFVAYGRIEGIIPFSAIRHVEGDSVWLKGD